MAIKKQRRAPTPAEAERGAKIRNIRLKMPLVSGKRMTGERFGLLFGVKSPRISGWEKGEKPPLEALLKLVELAPDEATKSYFLSEAGITEQSEILLRSREVFLRQRELKSDPEDIVMLPVRASAKAASDEYTHKIVVPATRIPNPKSSFCVEVSAESARGPYGVASLVIVDGSQNQILRLDGKAPTLAVFFEELPLSETLRRMNPSAPLLVESFPKYRGASAPHSDREFKIDDWRLGPGVRFGTVELLQKQTAGGIRWSFVLSHLGQDGPVIELTNWKDALPPTDKAARSILKKDIHVLGAVIGWFAPVAGSIKKEADD